MIKSPRRSALLAIAAAILSNPAQAQTPASRDTLRLGALQADATRLDPRALQIDLLASQSALRLRSIDAERMPSLAVNGQAQYQSTVASIPFVLPGVSVPTPPRDTYDAHLAARQRLFDPALRGRRNVERAQLAESQARVRASLYLLRQNVNEAFFSALELQSQRSELTIAVTDLEAQLRVATERVKEGTALASEARIIEAELLRRRQSVADATSRRNAALQILGDLTGRTISTTAELVLPETSSDLARVRFSLDSVRARPEYEQFARSRDVLREQSGAISARDLPRVSAFGRAGYGRPGLNPLASEFDTYWVAGLQLEWTPWSWGTTRRDREILSLQQRIVEREEAAFTESVQRSIVRDLAAIDRLVIAIAEDDVIVDLREQVMREARLRLGEGVITSAEYVDRQTDALAARVARSVHRIELEQARARFLTSLGLEVR